MLTRLDLRGLGVDVASSLPRPNELGDGPSERVRAIIAEVRADGDDALRRFTAELDGVEVASIAVARSDIEAALDRTPANVRSALTASIERVRAFHEHQVPADTIVESDGMTIRSYAKPVGSVGCYVPGGRAAYPSTLIMTVIPARVAGVERVVVCVPPDRATGRVADVTLAAAALAEVDDVYSIGGAQAIAALAYGTASVAPVDVICGPGNSYVAVAKQQVAGRVAIAAAFAGPSEIVVVADQSAPSDFVAIDLMVQAEHGPDGLAWMVCWDDATADAVDASLERLVAVAPRAGEIRSTLSTAGISVICDGPEAALAVVNAIAPEHLQLMCANPEALVPGVENAGAIFCGPWAPASLGDYAAGPSHVLPTHGSARFSSALTVGDFVKHHHVVTCDRAGFDALAPIVETLASAEGLMAHAESIRLRRES